LTCVFPFLLQLVNTRRRMEQLLDHQPTNPDEEYYETGEQLAAPLLAIYESLHESSAGIIADGRLADTIRRCHTFGMNLMKLDLRQVCFRVLGF
jgi:phosphoenolpyruvate carboxylase